MIVILKKSLPLMIGLFLLVTSLQGTGAATRGIRGRQQGQSDALAFSGRSSGIERELKGKKKCNGKKSMKKCGKGKPPSASSTNPDVSGRFDLPAVSNPSSAPAASAPAFPTLTTWINECTIENSSVDACAPNSNTNCKRCLHALSFTSATPSTADSGVNACARDFCDQCTKEDIMPFFSCGYEVKNRSTVTDPVTIPDPSIRTPPPTNATDASLQTPIFDETIIDLVNCPAVYPKSDTICTMIEGFEFKKCRYYEVGADVKCECSEDRPIWNCTGTITNPDYMNTAGSTDEEEGEDIIQPLPSVNIVASRIEVVAAEVGGL